MKPGVSVVMIFRDEEQFIAGALASVLNQQYTDWELILVDDGSIDNSKKIALKVLEKVTQPVVYLSHPKNENRGMSASRKLGVANSHGKAIGFLDADDVWETQKLNEQIDILRRFPEISAVYGRTLIWNSWQGDSARPASDTRTDDFFYDLGVEPDQVANSETLFHLLLENQCQSPTTCNILFRREFFDRSRFVDAFTGMYEDQVLYFQLFAEESVYVAGKVWARYRQHDDSEVARHESANEYFSGRLMLLEWLSDYVENLPRQKSSLKGAVRKTLFAYRYPRLAASIRNPSGIPKRIASRCRRLFEIA
ncbi:MAG: hypothetical protein NPIRA05_05020 [Nitrospirales bacterium]|nr:MAG: hypothetical protein NPIRA05_05020 [Nitrospirales bacterium]